MALDTHLHEKPRGAVVGEEAGASTGATQTDDSSHHPVEFIPILEAPGVNPEFVKMSEQTLRRIQAKEDAMFEEAQTAMDDLVTHLDRKPIPNAKMMLEHADKLTNHFPKIWAAVLYTDCRPTLRRRLRLILRIINELSGKFSKLAINGKNILVRK